MATVPQSGSLSSIIPDALSKMNEPLYEGNLRPQLMSQIEPWRDNPETVMKEIDYGGETSLVEVRPATQHWALYYMDGLTMCCGPGGIEAHNRFLKEHIPVCREADRLEDLGVNLSQKLALAVVEATIEYYEDRSDASPHYVH